MGRTDIPEDVLRFITRRIDSVPHLEALLLLRENLSTAWTEEEISTRVYVSRDQARSILQDLARHGLITASTDFPDRYLYDSAWDEAQIMPKVATAYRRHLVYVSSLIHSKASSEAVREFARAFQLKDDKDT
jgi:hypothetical protein